MMKRVTWFAGGVAAGAVGATYAKRRVTRTVQQMAPTSVVKRATDSVRRSAEVVADAVREGRQAMRQHEDELHARREGRLTSLDEHVEPGDQVYVDGVPVDSGRVIVMRQR